MLSILCLSALVSLLLMSLLLSNDRRQSSDSFCNTVTVDYWCFSQGANNNNNKLNKYRLKEFSPSSNKVGHVMLFHHAGCIKRVLFQLLRLKVHYDLTRTVCLGRITHLEISWRVVGWPFHPSLRSIRKLRTTNN